MSRLMVVGLDGFDPEVGRHLRAQGKLPNLAQLEQSSHRFDLDPGVERYTGLAWEVFSSGLTPEESSRWSANVCDTERYWPDQPTTHLTPFTEFVPVRTAVFDLPYFDLRRTSRAEGMVAWGAHDPGAPQNAKPEGLLKEIAERFGAYPAPEFIYGHVWNNPAKTAEMAAAMEAAVHRRSDITAWLFGERLKDWDLAITVIAEYHSATEALWHGWDESHPLHGLASAAPARNGLVAVYEAADRMLGRLMREFPDARLLAFTPHGMGPNKADVPAMLLLPELLYRHYSGRTAFRPDESWPLDGSGGPNLPPEEHWSVSVLHRMDVRPMGGMRQESRKSPLDWMPAAQYRTAWPGMRAFALPAYYEGMIRINLKGRESRGIVALDEYPAEVERVADLIRSCRDPISGEPIAVDIAVRTGDPLKRHPTDADLSVRFPESSYYAFRHPALGLIGPAPCRRPGGHTGGLGRGYFYANGDAGSELGVFRTTEMSDAISAWMEGRPANGELGAALLRADGGGGSPVRTATCVDVCVATYKRPALLRDLLTSLLQQRTPPDIRVRVIVVDNDANQSARAVVEEFASTKLAAIYDCEPERNISIARNRSVALATAEWIATIDDDAVADPEWIEKLIGAARRYKADIVFGSVERRLPQDAPAYLRDSGVFQLLNPPTGTTQELVYNTINSFFRRSLIAGRPQPFSVAFGLTGGEDTDLFFDLQMRRNARAVSCREAKVTETILPDRANLSWRLRRSFREGTTRYRVYRRWNIRPDVPLPYRFLHLARWCTATGASILAGAIRGVTNRDSRHAAVRNLNQLVYNLGIAAQTLGFGTTEYKHPPNAA